MSDKYTTARIIAVLKSTVHNYHAGMYPDMKWIDEEAITAIIRKLRAADALCEAAKDASAALGGEGYAKQAMRLDHAIADYDEA